MYCLGIRRHILRNELLAFCKLLTQSASVDSERTPFHRCTIRERNQQLRRFSWIRYAGVGDNLPSSVQPLHHNEIISLYQPIAQTDIVGAGIVAKVSRSFVVQAVHYIIVRSATD